VTAKATGYVDATVESDPTAAVGEGAIVNDGKPGISGPLTVGSELTATPGTWTPTPGSVSYQWLADGVEIEDATGSTYTLTAAELNKVITVKVTAEATGYADKTVESDPTLAVSKGGVTTVTPPTVTGTAGVGQTLTVSPGVWQPAPDSVTYQWLANGVPIPGATGTSLVVTPALAGATITVAVTAHRAGYADATAVFTLSTPVTKAASSMAVKIKPKKVKVGKRIKVVVTVTTAAGVTVTGPVTVKLKGQKARTATVVNGTATVKLKKVRSPGKKKLLVTYQGSTAVSGSSATTKVKVRR
jgi:5'-nucleotidase